MVKLVDTLVLEASAQAWRFESVLGHQVSMRGSYSGNTSAFQADAESSILLPRSMFLKWKKNLIIKTIIRFLLVLVF